MQQTDNVQKPDITHTVDSGHIDGSGHTKASGHTAGSGHTDSVTSDVDSPPHQQAGESSSDPGCGDHSVDKAEAVVVAAGTVR